MTSEVRDKINYIMLDDLSKIQKMEITDKDRKMAIDNVKTLAELDINDYEANTKLYKEEESVKTERRKLIVEGVKTGLSFMGGFGGTLLVIVAGQKGWFIDRLALSTIPNKKWF